MPVAYQDPYTGDIYTREQVLSPEPGTPEYSLFSGGGNPPTMPCCEETEDGDFQVCAGAGRVALIPVVRATSTLSRSKKRGWSHSNGRLVSRPLASE